MCVRKASFNVNATSSPKDKQHPAFRHKEKCHRIFGLDNVRFYLDRESVTEANLISQLEALAVKDPVKNWGWFVQSTHKLSKQNLSIFNGTKTVEQLIESQYMLRSANTPR